MITELIDYGVERECWVAGENEVTPLRRKRFEVVAATGNVWRFRELRASFG